ncbi:trypsin-like serine peptidase [Falsiroseomonas tokyonensis]|uniref:Trypsin-like serine peptidase n=1 Tax=Falsiroseomonas tokyonensis TaxID=430521 RepID=A0ABV7C348_9PROT|nr:trypsin-like serine protease [Falsiroseomonas tokyonensis]MBU8540729.1 trypsin-like serine protease [Falsiroseomonas tokyonensis]
MILFRVGLLLLAAPAAAQLPGVADSTARRPARVAEAPWSSLVRVQSEAGGRCTGVLIAPDRVLTAAHCLVARRTARLLQPGRVHVLAGYDRGDFSAHATATALRVGPGFDPATKGPVAADWSVLRLEKDLPGPVLPLAALPAPGTAAMLGGWQQDRAHALLADTACRIEAAPRDEAGRRLLRHDCAGTHGVSGAPLLVRQGPGWAVAGLTVAASRTARGGLAVAAQEDWLR